ncbi:MAG TPA: leucyl aminopeptidase [Mycobacteriales bacterium]|nr:leucyl aminopeptidase [Mycobacteriales bacterium]
MTTLALTDTPPESLNADAVVIGLHTGGTLAPGAEGLDAALGGRLAETLRLLGARGDASEVTKLATLGATTAPVVVAVGLGDPAKTTPETLRRAAGAAVRALAGTARVALALPLDGEGTLRAVSEGALLGAYDFTAYKSSLDGRPAPVGAVSVVVPAAADKAARAEAKRATAVAAAVHRSRDWINTPPNDLRPPAFADAAAAAAGKAGLEVEVLDERALKRGGYGGILAVGMGSEAPPRLVRIAWSPRGAKKHVALVGKGITFDTGGISIKPAAGMHEMKSDMSGAASVIATMLAIAALKPKVRVTAYVPMAENMPSGSAYRPGDVVTMYDGKRVEVLNTDAEGRMVLGDALARAVEDEPDYLFETSTLTGGQVVALGSRVSGVMGTPDVTARVKAAGERTGEAMWPMPLPEEVRSGMDSPIADLSQINAGGDRSAHMLQGGTFLSEFVGDVPWAHIDIAGPSYNGGQPWGHVSKGGTGVPVRTLLELVEEIAAEG